MQIVLYLLQRIRLERILKIVHGDFPSICAKLNYLKLCIVNLRSNCIGNACTALEMSVLCLHKTQNSNTYIGQRIFVSLKRDRHLKREVLHKINLIL